MMVDSGKEKKMVALVDGWEAKAHHHAGLAVAAAGVGEGWVREREICQARWGMEPI